MNPAMTMPPFGAAPGAAPLMNGIPSGLPTSPMPNMTPVAAQVSPTIEKMVSDSLATAFRDYADVIAEHLTERMKAMNYPIGVEQVKQWMREPYAGKAAPTNLLNGFNATADKAKRKTTRKPSTKTGPLCCLIRHKKPGDTLSLTDRCNKRAATGGLNQITIDGTTYLLCTTHFNMTNNPNKAYLKTDARYYCQPDPGALNSQQQANAGLSPFNAIAGPASNEPFEFVNFGPDDVMLFDRQNSLILLKKGGRLHPFAKVVIKSDTELELSNPYADPVAAPVINQKVQQKQWKDASAYADKYIETFKGAMPGILTGLKQNWYEILRTDKPVVNNFQPSGLLQQPSIGGLPGLNPAIGGAALPSLTPAPAQPAPAQPAGGFALPSLTPQAPASAQPAPAPAQPAPAQPTGGFALPSLAPQTQAAPAPIQQAPAPAQPTGGFALPSLAPQTQAAPAPIQQEPVQQEPAQPTSAQQTPTTSPTSTGNFTMPSLVQQAPAPAQPALAPAPAQPALAPAPAQPALAPAPAQPALAPAPAQPANGLALPSLTPPAQAAPTQPAFAQPAQAAPTQPAFAQPTQPTGGFALPSLAPTQAAQPAFNFQPAEAAQPVAI